MAAISGIMLLGSIAFYFVGVFRRPLSRWDVVLLLSMIVYGIGGIALALKGIGFTW